MSKLLKKQFIDQERMNFVHLYRQYISLRTKIVKFCYGFPVVNQKDFLRQPKFKIQGSIFIYFISFSAIFCYHSTAGQRSASSVFSFIFSFIQSKILLTLQKENGYLTNIPIYRMHLFMLAMESNFAESYF